MRTEDRDLKIPQHVAIILDGNGRWAKAKGMPRSYGHIKGCDNLEKISDVAIEVGIKYLTVYAFSTENWKRSKEEIDGLMNLFRQYLKKCKKMADKNHDVSAELPADENLSDTDAVPPSSNVIKPTSTAFQ